MAYSPEPLEETKEMMDLTRRFNAAFLFPPKKCDSERGKRSLPCMQFPLPSGWPTTPPVGQIMDTKFYAGLGLEALFFMFYYEEGSLAQILAAKTLKAKDWRFHKARRTWFQRIDPPKVKNNDFERGSYRYWDFHSWSEKQLGDFTFEYRYLENIELSGEFGR